MIGSSVDYVRSGGMRNVPVTKAVEHLYATTAKFSVCVLLASRPTYSYPPRRQAIHIHSKMEILEHEKEKTIVKVENLWKIALRLRKAGCATELNSSPSCSDCKVGPLFEGSGKSKRLPRKGPHFEAT
ncbi:hypothetical protein AVEN_43378-1 [Araneus ventricosus]|uniref:Uncharacterized protein n=1 Tax=Araneus ventricosus TaxID=182803 RepID=A0A4Y2HEN6_ARAVE|nr:hypothetical protein AVEN_43378-1 [Araneus ventricosus]